YRYSVSQRAMYDMKDKPGFQDYLTGEVSRALYYAMSERKR
ncbi:unnamed protein product, partial [marine sediment metagenome]